MRSHRVSARVGSRLFALQYGSPVVPPELSQPEHERTAPARPLVDSEYSRFVYAFETETFCHPMFYVCGDMEPTIQIVLLFCDVPKPVNISVSV